MPYITGTEVNYYFICKTKLWLFSHYLQMERENENVKIGKQIHEDSFKKKEKNIRIGPIAFDFIEKENGIKVEIHETKKSPKMKKATKYQILYYLYHLKKRGIEAKAILHFPQQRKKEKIKLDKKDKTEIEEILEEIRKIEDKEEMPKPKKKKRCKKCAYRELCWI